MTRMKGSLSRQPPPCVSEGWRMSSCYQEVSVLLAGIFILDLICAAAFLLKACFSFGEVYSLIYSLKSLWLHVNRQFYWFLPGLKVVAQNFPEGMTTGTLPASCRVASPSRRRKSSQRQQQQQQQRPQAAETRWWFTEEELAKIQKQLDQLHPYNICSSKTFSLISAVCMSASCRMSSCLLSQSHFFVPYRPSVIHQLNIQLSDNREGQPRSSEDTLEINSLSTVQM